MKLWEIFRFEFTYQVRRAWPWLTFAVLIVISFLMARDVSVSDALYEDFLANSPFQIAITTVIGSLVWLLLAPSIAGEAAARDVSTGMYPLTYTAPVSRTEYLGGRFLAALALNALILLAVQTGILLGIYSPGVDARVIGPFRPEACLTAYAFISLANAFFAVSIQFSLSLRAGRPMAGFLGSLFLVFMGFFVATFIEFFVKRGMGALLDPVGIHFIVEDLAHLWTTFEKNWRLLALEGNILTNRLLWFSAGLLTLALTYMSFRFHHRTSTSWWSRIIRRLNAMALDPYGSQANSPFPESSIGTMAVPEQALGKPAFGFSFHLRQTLAIAWDSFRTIAKSWAGLAMLVAIPLITVLVVLDQMQSLGAPLIPATERVLRELTGGLSAEMAAEPNRWVIIPLFVVFFAGELIWREREAGLDEITGAMPGSDWAPLMGKFLGLSFLIALFMALLTASGMLAQLLMGYHNFEIGLYLKILFGLQLPEYLLFAVLAIVAHVLVNHKYIGHLVAILIYVFIAVLAAVLGIEHNLLVYGAAPAWSYSEMRGFGPFFWPWLWFKLYWTAWALLLSVVARLLWVRGKEGKFTLRLRIIRSHLTTATALIGGIAVMFILTLGGFIFYNTNILNDYRSTSGIKELRAEYERRYGQYENNTQPQLTAAKLQIEIFPEQGAADIGGSYSLVNRSLKPIDSIHLSMAVSGAETRMVTFDRTARLALNDNELGYRIYDLGKPLEPGDTLRLNFQVHIGRRGFSNRGIDHSITQGGSYFTNASWFPFVGFQRQRALISAADRREHGLPQRPLIASLYDADACKSAMQSEGITFEAVVGTVKGQLVVAPGALRRTWTNGNRSYFHYSSDAPLGGEWAFFSAGYSLHQEQWIDPKASEQKIDIRIFHHPKHTAHLTYMVRSVQASLDYYSSQFSPYPYRHLSLVEHPIGTGTGAHADAGLISYGQGFASWIAKDEQGSLDFPYAVVAHEMAHQWTLPYALVEGAPFLSEGLAWYSAIQLVKASRGSQQLRQLLSFMREPYPHRPIRRGEPLLRALDPYLSYRRGPFAMYALSEYIGTERVNSALESLIKKHRSDGAPLVTTLDLYRELKAVTPDSLKYMLHDLFEVNTYWELKTRQAAANKTKEGWQVTLEVQALKIVYDSTGLEKKLQVNDWIELGVFAPSGKDSELNAPLYLQKHRIRSGLQRIKVTVPQKPALAGIDPYHLLDWEDRDNENNIIEVKIER